MLPLLLIALLQDTTGARSIQVAPHETLETISVGTGPAVVLIPGLLGGAYSFRKVMPELGARGYRAVAVEPLGFGESGRPRQADYSLTAQADRIGRALDSLGISHALIVSASLGSSIALRLAYRRPELVRGVLSIDGGPVESASTPGLRRALRLAPLLKHVVGQGTIRREVKSGLVRNSGDTTWITESVLDRYTQGPGQDVGATLDALRGMSQSKEPELLHDHLHEIQAPVLLLVGTAPHEAAVDTTEIEALRTGLPTFLVDSLPAAGQYLQEERPDAVCAALQRLDQVAH